MNDTPADGIRIMFQDLSVLFGADVGSPGFIADPYARASPALAEGPVRRLPGGTVAALGHRAAARVLRDPRFGHGATTLYGTTLAGVRARSFMQLDPPGHARLRGQVATRFAPHRIAAMESTLSARVRALVRERAGRDIDFVTDFAEPLAMSVISDFLGIPEPDRHQFHHDSRLVVRGLDDAAHPAADPAIGQARYRFMRYFRKLAERRRHTPQGDLVSTMVHSGGASTGELLTTCGLVMSAGYETTVDLLSSAVLELARLPEGAGWRMAEEPQKRQAMVEEVLRLHPPVMGTARSALTGADVDGAEVEKGTTVAVLLAAANRDPHVYEQPHAFLPDRYLGPAGSGSKDAPPRHLSFGGGPHFCLGAALARLEADIVLSALAPCRPQLTGEWSYKDSLSVRGLRRLPVRWRARPPAGP
ncbi:cytochrome P450 [Streptomyces sp. SCA3-4]|uniref:cytochrome P450 n=1 Tax=Streptomyces sichuanensis TaxID=2871810 RepID=UPI001CE324D3|nr:cytochrome P450 [Streptomyces sichuanensis]MCA6091909.1 cytochrome P450 [Streptomyces sichuanensis]